MGEVTWEEVPLPDEFLPKPMTVDTGASTLHDLAVKLGWFGEVRLDDPVAEVTYERLLRFKPSGRLFPEPEQGMLWPE